MPFPFSLSFPSNCRSRRSRAAVAAVLVFIACFDQEELRGEHLHSRSFRHSQLALTVLAQATFFHGLTRLDDRWYVVGGIVIVSALVGYAISTMVIAGMANPSVPPPPRPRVARDARRRHRRVSTDVLGLAFFSLLVAKTTSTDTVGLQGRGLAAPLAASADAPADPFPGARDRGARSQAGGERAPSPARSSDGPPGTGCSSNAARRSRSTGWSRPAQGRRDADGSRPPQEINDALGHHLGEMSCRHRTGSPRRWGEGDRWRASAATSSACWSTFRGLEARRSRIGGRVIEGLHRR